MSELEQLKGSGLGVELRDRCEELSRENSQLAKEVHNLRSQLAEKVERVKVEGRESLEREVEWLSGECGIAKDEATALRYQLSSNSMELQQLKEVSYDLHAL